MDIKEFISREKARADCFRFLSACFCQPQKEVFIREGLFKNLSASLKQSCPAALSIAGDMEMAFIKCSEEDLLVEYARLFVGPNEIVAPPYGSVYLDRDRRVMGDSTMAAVDFYKSQGVVMDGDFREVPDHIAVELEFMYYLVFKEIEATEASDMTGAAAVMEAQELFMNKFLRQWTEKFAGKITEGAETGFYRALAGCLYSFIYKIDIKDSLPEELTAAAVSQC